MQRVMQLAVKFLPAFLDVRLNVVAIPEPVPAQHEPHGRIQIVTGTPQQMRCHARTSRSLAAFVAL